MIDKNNTYTTLLKVLENPVKKEILRFISEHGEAFYGDLVAATKMDQSIVLLNLLDLKNEGLVKKNSQPATYSITDNLENKIKQNLRTLKK